MDILLSYITWDVSPEIVQIGPITLRWYGLLFASGFLAGLYIVSQMFKAENEPEEWLDKIFMYVIIGAVLGARLGHVFFYAWDYYAQHPTEIPMIWRGGLASHGGAIGIIIALWIFSRLVSKRSVLWILDKVVVPTALAGCFIRLGNLFNSEILGKPGEVAWAFLFPLADNPPIPRHPVQLYESFSYLISFFILYYVYWKTDKRHKQGYIFGLFLVLIWGFRMIWEAFKTDQGGELQNVIDSGLTTGQLLSIPFILIGLYFMFRPMPAKKPMVKKRNKR